MPRFNVTIRETVAYVIQVEADTPEDADLAATERLIQEGPEAASEGCYDIECRQTGLILAA